VTKIDYITSIADSIVREERFEADPVPGRYAELARECLAIFPPWSTPCLVPAGFDPIKDTIPSLLFEGSAREDQNQLCRVAGRSLGEKQAEGRRFLSLRRSFRSLLLLERKKCGISSRWSGKYSCPGFASPIHLDWRRCALYSETATIAGDAGSQSANPIFICGTTNRYR